MTEQKQPQAGEWWQKDGTRVCVVGTKKNGLTVGEMQSGTLIPFMSIHDWQHLPDCDSFEWQPEVFPQYWTAKQTDSNRDAAFVELKQGGDWVQHYRDGGEYLITVVPFHKGGRTQLTKEQAEALQSPQESPDDWVEITDPEHVRRECDFVAGKTDHPDEWNQCTTTIGWSQAAYPESKLRCRRKDLPVVKSPPVGQLPAIDNCGNKWYPFEVARHWSIGVPVVVRVTARETGLFMYSIASRWQSPGINTFGDSAVFLMLDRMPQ